MHAHTTHACTHTHIHTTYTDITHTHTTHAWHTHTHTHTCMYTYTTHMYAHTYYTRMHTHTCMAYILHMHGRSYTPLLHVDIPQTQDIFDTFNAHTHHTQYAHTYYTRMHTPLTNSSFIVGHHYY